MREPRIDRSAVDAALQAYLAVRGHGPKSLRWCSDARTARAYIRQRTPREPRPAYWPDISIASVLDLAWFACAMRPPIETSMNCIEATADWDDWIRGVACFNAALSQNPESIPSPDLLPLNDGFPEPPDAGKPLPPGWVDALVGRGAVCNVHPERLWAPLVEAFAHGLYSFWIGPDEIVCAPRPSLWVVHGRLHREDGPAVSWSTGEKYFFWRGMEVHEVVIAAPGTMTPTQIREEPDPVRRRCMFERFGPERFVRETGAKLLTYDGCGNLWEVELAPFDRCLVIKLSHVLSDERRYFWDIPQAIRTPTEAVSWIRANMCGPPWRLQ